MVVLKLLRNINRPPSTTNITHIEPKMAIFCHNSEQFYIFYGNLFPPMKTVHLAHITPYLVQANTFIPNKNLLQTQF